MRDMARDNACTIKTIKIDIPVEGLKAEVLLLRKDKSHPVAPVSTLVRACRFGVNDI